MSKKKPEEELKELFGFMLQQAEGDIDLLKKVGEAAGGEIAKACKQEQDKIRKNIKNLTKDT